MFRPEATIHCSRKNLNNVSLTCFKMPPTLQASLLDQGTPVNPRRGHAAPQGHQRVGNRSSDRDGNHARPPSSPRQSSMEQSRWSVTGPHCGQAFRQLESFLAPCSSLFESDNDQATLVATEDAVRCPVLKREPRWPCHHWLPLLGSCRGASQCN